MRDIMRRGENKMENVKAVHDGDAPQPDRVTMFMCPCCRMVFREYDNYMRHWSEERDRDGTE